MEKHTLTVQPRTVLGKRLKQLRAKGLLPANIYGKAVNSQAVQVEQKSLEKLLAEVGETSVVNVTIEGQEGTVPVLLHNVQVHPVTKAPLHVDLYQVNLKEKIKAHVPIVLVGEAKAVVEKIGVILELLHEIEVEALPTDLPENWEVNIEGLATVGEQILVGDIKLPGEVELLTDKEQVIVRVGELIVKEKVEEKPATTETPAATEGVDEKTATTETRNVSEDTEKKDNIKKQEKKEEKQNQK